MLAPNICGWKLLLVTLLAARILRWPLDFQKIFIPQHYIMMTCLIYIGHLVVLGQLNVELKMGCVCEYNRIDKKKKNIYIAHWPENVFEQYPVLQREGNGGQYWGGYQVGCRDVASKCSCLYCKQNKCPVSLSQWYCSGLSG